MDLEKRVQALEQELQVLKNQIQATLLDIQEQLLTNAYPSLRAETPALPATRPQPLDEFPVPVAPDTPAAPVIKKVSLDALPPAPPTPPIPPTAIKEPLPVPPAETLRAPDVDWNSVEAVEEWVYNRIEKLGPQRTLKLVEVYASEGHVGPKVADMLRRLVSLFEDEQLAAPCDAEPDYWPQSFPAPQDVLPGWPDADSLSSPALDDLPALPARRSNGHHSPEAPFPAPGTDDPDNSQKLILRLIAGVQNAGAGITRKNNHG